MLSALDNFFLLFFSLPSLLYYNYKVTGRYGENLKVTLNLLTGINLNNNYLTSNFIITKIAKNRALFKFRKKYNCNNEVSSGKLDKTPP